MESIEDNVGEQETNTVERKKKHKCTYPDCQAAYITPFKLQRHIRQHTGERPYICKHPGCTKSYISSCHLKRHSKTHEPVQTRFQCPKCPRTLSRLYILRHHYREQHGNNKISCQECGMSFTKKYQLAKHQTIHFGPVPHVCDKCGKSFVRNYKLKRHIRESHEKKYPCPISGCTEIFDKWSLLRSHKAKKHVIEHKCDKCNKVFLARSHLKSHCKIHSEDREMLPCPYEKCPKAYCYKSNLEHHIKIRHLGERVYCDICSVGFTCKRTLIHHIKLHHEPKKQKSSRRQMRKRKDTGVPKVSVVSKLIGWKLPHDLEKKMLVRETMIKISDTSDKLSNNLKIKPVECIL